MLAEAPRRARRRHVQPAVPAREARRAPCFVDADIVDHMIFLMMAAHDTTTSTLTSMTYELAKHPHWQERVREESRALGTGELGFEDLDKLESLTWVMKEIAAPLPAAAGHPARRDAQLRVRGYRVPARRHGGDFTDPHAPHGGVVERTLPLRSRALRAGARRAPAAHARLGPVRRRPAPVHRHALRRAADQGDHAPVAAALPLERARRLHMPVQQAPISKPLDGLPIELRRI